MKFEENQGEGHEHRESISFDSVELCALNTAFENSENDDALLVLRKDFPDTYTDSKSQFFKDTSNMKIDKEKFWDFLISMKGVVLSEKEQLSSKIGILSCGHQVAEHAAALKSVENKIKE